MEGLDFTALTIIGAIWAESKLMWSLEIYVDIHVYAMSIFFIYFPLSPDFDERSLDSKSTINNINGLRATYMFDLDSSTTMIY